MKKRTAEKVITRSILALAVYRKSTMGRAVRRRPRFWTVSKPVSDGQAATRRRLVFGEEKGQSRFTMDYGEALRGGAEKSAPPTA